MYHYLYAIALALYAQPDAKLANGMYWTEVWLHLAQAVITWLCA